MEPNFPLIRKTMEYIEDHPEEWNQAWWVTTFGCKATMCFAGTAMMLAGHELKEGEHYASYPVRLNGQRMSHGEFADAAAKELGLSGGEAGRIFNSLHDTPKALRRLVEDVVGERL